MWTIFGAGDLVWDMLDAIEARGEGNIQIVLNQKLKTNFKPYKTITLKNYLKPKIVSDEREFRIFGFIDPNKHKFLDQLKLFINSFSNLIHPHSWVSGTAQLGFGNFFNANSTLASKSEIQDFNYINRNASIGHHTTIGSHNHIGPGATICGKCKIGSINFFGAGCVVKDGITIKSNVIVGANALVTTDLLEKGIYFGSPARRIDTVPGGVVAKFYA